MPPLPLCWTTIAAPFAARSGRTARRKVGLRRRHVLLRGVDGLLVPVWVLLLRGYRVVFGPVLAGSCRFEPTCSHYAEEAVRRYGSLRGLWLTCRRLGRCHPFHAGGYDPVPHRADQPDLRARTRGV